MRELLNSLSIIKGSDFPKNAILSSVFLLTVILFLSSNLRTVPFLINLSIAVKNYVLWIWEISIWTMVSGFRWDYNIFV